MLQMVLSKQGFTDIIQCIDGINALEVIERQGIDTFDIIFMDSQMPNLSGPETATKLRSMNYQNLIIGVTGNALDIDVDIFETAGVDIVFAKPLKIENITKLISYIEKYGTQSSHPLLSLSANHPCHPVNNQISLKDHIFK
jgi:CheY-like chemotaxis protein